MTLPTSAYDVVVFLVLVLPGVVYGVVRAALVGSNARDKDISARLLQAMLAGVTLDAVYLLLLGRWVVTVLGTTGQTLAAHPRQAALAVLLLGVLIPATASFFIHSRYRWLTMRPGVRVPVPMRSDHRSIPTAWDRVAGTSRGRWVRIRLADGKWVGGWYGSGSYVSAYPEPRDIYIAVQFRMSPEGEFGARLDNTAGVWLAIRDDMVVEWIERAAEEENDDA